MRTIKSQNGKMIVNAEKVQGICVCENDSKWRITAFDTWAGNDTVGLLGVYTTEKRALLVLNALNEWLCTLFPQKPENPDWKDWYEDCLWNYPRFNMPQDSEELDA